MSDFAKTIEQAKAEALAAGQTVIEGTANTLLLDLDTAAQRAQFTHFRGLVHEQFMIIGEEEWSSKSGNRHVVLTLVEPLDAALRIALQCAMGSDPMRAILSVRDMALRNVPDPNLLFRPADAVVRDRLAPVPEIPEDHDSLPF